MPSRAPILSVLLIGLLWGLNWPAVKLLLTELPPLTLRALVFPLSALVLAGLAAARGERLRPARGDLPAIALAGCLLVLGFNSLTALAQTVTETSRAAILAYTMPAMTAGLSALFLGERPDGRLWLALGLGMAGLAALATEDFAGLVAAPAGTALTLGAALSWALGIVVLKSRAWSLRPLALNAWFFGVSAVGGWLLVLAFEGPPDSLALSPPALAVFAFHLLGPMTLAYAVFTALVERVDASVAALATLASPVVAVLSSILLLGDAATSAKGAALFLILASIAATLRRTKPGGG